VQPGDLRRFTDDMIGSVGPDRVAGQTFMVIDVYDIARPPYDSRTDFLVGGRIETCWNAPWIETHSEVISEEG